MSTTTRLPNIHALVDPLLGLPYEAFTIPESPQPSNACWGLVRHLLWEGFQLDLAADPVQAAQSIVEIWFEDDPRDPLTLVQPWDAWILHVYGPDSDHVGLVVDSEHFVHVRKRAGVVIEPLQRLRPKLLQVARLRHLL